ncbi:ATP synthase F1 subunit gamma [Paenibacillus physcomitrellae]|uniref:ATP synthase gamma chain n=1 Tax=Paenibacillus physcomitrellae TaxID=1619311 RepID=A0ABQ1GGA0_9BACL|nr:ATP synthase F1 subunit gamma [Paenibacillus physcomitrellae]GGA43043.1 ATP synthase gamma chain [Paenibacillus physcomitrellae]
MAKGIREIKRQIKSVQNTRQITKAMEMVASAKLRRAQEKAQAARPYEEKLKEVVTSIAAGSQGVSHPMLETRPIKRTAYIVITSDGGLVGGYNSNMLRKVMERLAQHASKEEYGLFVVGRKGRDYFNRRNLPVVETVVELSDTPSFADIKKIASAAVQGFENEQFDEIYICFNRFINPLTQVPTIDRLLPFERVESSSNGELKASYEYEPSPEGVLEVLLPKYAETLIYGALLEGKASELGAKMTAMGSATKNASKMIGELTLTYNRARQAAITQEITEIVAGANAQS